MDKSASSVDAHFRKYELITAKFQKAMKSTRIQFSKKILQEKKPVQKEKSGFSSKKRTSLITRAQMDKVVINTSTLKEVTNASNYPSAS